MPKSGSYADLESPNSIIAKINIKTVLNNKSLALLPAEYQQELISLLPECDQIQCHEDLVRINADALSNVFYSKACNEWTRRLRNGDFTNENQQKMKAEWEKSQKVNSWKAQFFGEENAHKQPLVDSGQVLSGQISDWKQKFCSLKDRLKTKKTRSRKSEDEILNDKRRTRSSTSRLHQVTKPSLKSKKSQFSIQPKKLAHQIAAGKKSLILKPLRKLRSSHLSPKRSSSSAASSATSSCLSTSEFSLPSSATPPAECSVNSSISNFASLLSGNLTEEQLREKQTELLQSIARLQQLQSQSLAQKLNAQRDGPVSNSLSMSESIVSVSNSTVSLFNSIVSLSNTTLSVPSCVNTGTSSHVLIVPSEGYQGANIRFGVNNPSSSLHDIANVLPRSQSNFINPIMTATERPLGNIVQSGASAVTFNWMSLLSNIPRPGVPILSLSGYNKNQCTSSVLNPISSPLSSSNANILSQHILRMLLQNQSIANSKSALSTFNQPISGSNESTRLKTCTDFPAASHIVPLVCDSGMTLSRSGRVFGLMDIVEDCITSGIKQENKNLSSNISTISSASTNAGVQSICSGSNYFSGITSMTSGLSNGGLIYSMPSTEKSMQIKSSDVLFKRDRSLTVKRLLDVDCDSDIGATSKKKIKRDSDICNKMKNDFVSSSENKFVSVTSEAACSTVKTSASFNLNGFRSDAKNSSTPSIGINEIMNKNGSLISQADSSQLLSLKALLMQQSLQKGQSSETISNLPITVSDNLKLQSGNLTGKTSSTESPGILIGKTDVANSTCRSWLEQCIQNRVKSGLSSVDKGADDKMIKLTLEELLKSKSDSVSKASSSHLNHNVTVDQLQYQNQLLQQQLQAVKQLPVQSNNSVVINNLMPANSLKNDSIEQPLQIRNNQLQSSVVPPAVQQQQQLSQAALIQQQLQQMPTALLQAVLEQKLKQHEQQKKSSLRLSAPVLFQPPLLQQPQAPLLNEQLIRFPVLPTNPIALGQVNAKISEGILMQQTIMQPTVSTGNYNIGYKLVAGDQNSLNNVFQENKLLNSVISNPNNGNLLQSANSVANLKNNARSVVDLISMSKFNLQTISAADSSNSTVRSPSNSMISKLSSVSCHETPAHSAMVTKHDVQNSSFGTRTNMLIEKLIREGDNFDDTQSNLACSRSLNVSIDNLNSQAVTTKGSSLGLKFNIIPNLESESKYSTVLQSNVSSENVKYPAYVMSCAEKGMSSYNFLTSFGSPSSQNLTFSHSSLTSQGLTVSRGSLFSQGLVVSHGSLFSQGLPISHGSLSSHVLNVSHGSQTSQISTISKQSISNAMTSASLESKLSSTEVKSANALMPQAVRPFLVLPMPVANNVRPNSVLPAQFLLQNNTQKTIVSSNQLPLFNVTSSLLGMNSVPAVNSSVKSSTNSGMLPLFNNAINPANISKVPLQFVMQNNLNPGPSSGVPVRVFMPNNASSTSNIYALMPVILPNNNISSSLPTVGNGIRNSVPVVFTHNVTVSYSTVSISQQPTSLNTSLQNNK